VIAIRQLNDRAALSIDFLAGFTIFLIAFIMVATLLSGLLVSLQSKHIDYDAVAYRTGVILVEDQGYGYDLFSNTNTTSWESISNTQDIYRFGLAVSRSKTGVLSKEKVDTFFRYPFTSDDFHKKAIFDEDPPSASVSPIYHFNITMTNITPGATGYPPVGEPFPLSSSTGYIHRVVKIRQPTLINPPPINKLNVPGATNQTFVYFDFPSIYSNLDPVYSADPFAENITIIFPNLDDILNGNTSRLTGLGLYTDGNPYLQNQGSDTLIPVDMMASQNVMLSINNTRQTYPLNTNVSAKSAITLNLTPKFFTSVANKGQRYYVKFQFSSNVTNNSMYMINATTATNTLLPYALEVRIW